MRIKYYISKLYRNLKSPDFEVFRLAIIFKYLCSSFFCYSRLISKEWWTVPTTEICRCSNRIIMMSTLWNVRLILFYHIFLLLIKFPITFNRNFQGKSVNLYFNFYFDNMILLPFNVIKFIIVFCSIFS